MAVDSRIYPSSRCDLMMQFLAALSIIELNVAKRYTSAIVIIVIRPIRLLTRHKSANVN